MYWDATLLRRLAGADIDVAARIPSDVICAAAEADPAMRAAVGAFQAMRAPPAVLDNVQDNARGGKLVTGRPAGLRRTPSGPKLTSTCAGIPSPRRSTGLPGTPTTCCPR